MSRRPPNPSVERAAQNQQTLKTLVKIESNKSCADCKKNKHPRWASWNLGIFICIRCSGIHRGMGTHISRVKSVDLDAWTDEQMQNMIRWGNARANKYWEAKLAPGHVPADGKIENFIRTKYDSKRWVMDGGMPDPATLDTGADDEVPLNVVQERAKLGHTARQPSTNTPPPPAQKSNPDIDLFGDNIGPPPPVSSVSRSSSANPPPTPPKADPVQAKTTKTSESLLGFDFFGDPGQGTAPPRPSSAASSIASSNAPSRPDLKQSILSLYASAPKTSTPPASQQSQTGGTVPPTSPPTRSTFGNLDSDFSSLSFGPSSATSRASSTQASGSFAPPSNKSFSPPPQQSFGGGFFDSKPAKPATSNSGTPNVTSPPVAQRGMSGVSGGFGDFGSATSPGGFNNSAAQPKSNALGDMFDFSSTSPPSTSNNPPPVASPPPNVRDSPFNLSSPPPQPSSKPEAKPAPAPAASMMNMDPWGSSDVWSSSNTTTAPAAAPPAPKITTTVSQPADDWGWGGSSGTGGGFNGSGGFGSPNRPAPQITADEDFGGWESSTVVSPTQQSKPATTPQAAPKPLSGLGATNDDLFSNVWE